MIKDGCLKICTRCKRTLNLDRFSHDNRASDGFKYWCKDCCRIQKNIWAKNNPDKRDALAARYRKKNRESINARQRIYAEKNKEKYRAYCKKYREEKGNLVKVDMKCWQYYKNRELPNKCTKCGSDRYLENHHEDYSRPFDIVRLCRSCHRLLHARLKKVA